MPRVYISPTYEDLKSHREAVYRALRRLDHDVKAMEDDVAADARPLDKCLAEVARCDVYVGTFAWAAASFRVLLMTGNHLRLRRCGCALRRTVWKARPARGCAAGAHPRFVTLRGSRQP
jgi:hypothetical protein